MSASRAIRELSARLGSDPTLVQGPGGNVSEKSGDTLSIKASGTWLSDALDKPVFVDVPLSLARDNAFRDPGPGVPKLENDGMRASIETGMHAILPHAVVLHVHCVDSIALGARADLSALEAALDGLNWSLVPYTKPGAGLARAIADAHAANGSDIFILRNHGLVIAGDSPEDADARLADYRARVGQSPNETPSKGDPAAALAAVRQATSWVEPAHDAVHQLAFLPPDMIDALCRGTLYPDHVVYLGRACDRWDDATSWDPGESKLLIVPGKGILLAPDPSPAMQEMALGLALVAARLGDATALQYIGRENEDALIDWDAEAYRRKLNS